MPHYNHRTAAVIDAVPFADESPPGEFLVVRYGETTYVKGRRQGSFRFAEKDADSIIADFAKRGKDIVVDYDHTTLVAPGNAPAAGWITQLEKRKEGLYARVEWTDRGEGSLRSREYRYHSPVISFGKSGNPEALHSVALTNHPAFSGYPPLAADDTNKETTMNEHIKRLAELLGVAVAVFDDGTPDEGETTNAIAEKLAELTASSEASRQFLELHGAESFDDMTGKIKGMVPAAEKQELERRLATIQAEKAVADAFDDGKLVEAQREWAMEYAVREPEAFSRFVKSAPAVAPVSASRIDGGVPPRSDDADNVKAFSQEELAIFARFGLTAEDIKTNNIKKEN